MSNGLSPGCDLCTTSELLTVAQSGAAEYAGAAPPTGIARFFSLLFDASDFPARWHCGTWDPFLGWLHIGADIAIFVAYAAIPSSLLYFILRRRDVPLRGIFWLFAAFILSCGITHLFDASMFYTPRYRLLGLMKFITAAVSLTTVVALLRVIPRALHLPGLLKVQEAQLAERKKYETEIAELNRQLFDRNSQLAVRQKRIEIAMRAARLGMICWNARTGVFEWEAGMREALGAGEHSIPHLSQWSDVFDTSELAAFMGAAMESARSDAPLAIELPVSSAISRQMRVRVAAARRGASSENPQIIGFARILDGKGLPLRAGAETEPLI